MQLMIKKVGNALDDSNLTANLPTPHYATDGAAGLDLSAAITQPITLLPNQRYRMPTGIAMAIPDGYVGLVFIRSSLGFKSGITLPNCVGVIDSDYRGEILVAMVNISDEAYTINPLDRIAQIVIVPAPQMQVVLADELPDTKRGSGGFGSTGV
ncbi:MAG: dUTP diphosphatase [Clostridiales bacterium]|jgi:dUTP pyrophosphatase|nr:dUTP diphosphatase [Clostridiales bacterium]